MYCVILFFVSAYAGPCTEYMGGESTFFGKSVHYFVCCDNCGEPDISCNGRTYQGGSSNSYCGSCGVTTVSASVITWYSCRDCSTQSRCSSRCSIWNFPGLCWKWASCFKHCCTSSSKRQATFCGDNICDSGESAETCPLDCCKTVNSMCNLSPSECSPECCSESTCCIDDGSGSAMSLSGQVVHILYTLSVGLLLLLL